MRALGGVIALSLVATTCGIRVPPEAAEVGGDFPCEIAEECPAPPNACLLSACWDEQCVYVPAPEGTLPPDLQRAGDCKELSCDGQGEIRSARAMRDLPADDDNPCTDAICDLDTPRQAPRIAGSRCGAEGICNGAGICGVCLPGEKRCEGPAVTTCSAEGAWSAAAACAVATPRCHRAECVGVVEIAAGGASACARFSDGSVMCWGAPVGAPEAAAGFERVDFGPRHACGIRDGEVFCWGAGDWGQLGRGGLSSSDEPVATGVMASQVAVGRDHSCALTPDGRVSCWGRNDRGQSGQPSGGAPSAEIAPVASAPGGSPPAPLVVEGASGLALNGPQICVRVGPRLDCWGGSRYTLAPELDENDPDQAAAVAARQKISVDKPTPIAQLVATAIDCGHDHCCAQLGDGSLRCWGAGDRGQLGGTTDSPVPTPLPGVSARSFGLGASFGCALTSEGVSCWGNDRRGQLGRGGAGSAPGLVPLVGPTALAVGDDFACALVAGGEVACWGAGAVPTGESESPVTVAW